ncbi:unnamed protein product [Rhizoctonia solani]|uniref:Uncharacterized protein n=1 Tax=Rhizoctonia solani TaxID=456999 RepID=A0A8H3B844_9AGAM|nr:unnamed protein product [Rhizoctonia solani]CAE6450044.1 unnamed protein product [Rhizoctonia solani]
MGHLIPGNYTLRILRSDEPDLYPGGMYATAQAPREPVRLEREGIQGQVWHITPGYENGQEVIRLKALGVNGDGVTYLHNESIEPEAPLILWEEKFFCANHERNIGSIGVYSIVPAGPLPIGVTWYVGQNHNQEVALQPFPLIPDGPPYPVWALIPADKN